MLPMLSRFVNAVLGRLERMLRIDVRYIASGGFFLSLTQVSSAFIGLALTIAFANLLPMETYGTYRYIIAVYALLAIAALPGVDTAVTQAVSKGHDGAFIQGIRTKFRWGLLGTAGTLVYAGYLYTQGSPVMAGIFVLVAIAIPFMESLSLYTSFLNGKKNFRVWSFIEIITQVVSAASLLCTIFITKNIFALMFAYFVPYLVCRTLATWFARRYIYNTDTTSDFLTYARSLTGFQIVSRGISSLDQIVLYHFLGPAQVAIFALATAVPNRVQSLLRISGSLALPKFANRPAEDVAAGLPRKMFLFILGVLAICGVYILLAPLMFTYIFPKYLPSLLYSQAVIFYTLSAITYPFGSYLFAHKKIRDTYILAIGGFVTKAVCLVALVPVVGIWGAVIGLLANSAMNIALTSYMIWRDIRLRPNTGT